MAPGRRRNGRRSYPNPLLRDWLPIAEAVNALVSVFTTTIETAFSRSGLTVEDVALSSYAELQILVVTLQWLEVLGVMVVESRTRLWKLRTWNLWETKRGSHNAILGTILVIARFSFRLTQTRSHSPSTRQVSFAQSWSMAPFRS